MAASTETVIQRAMGTEPLSSAKVGFDSTLLNGLGLLVGPPVVGLLVDPPVLPPAAVVGAQEVGDLLGPAVVAEILGELVGE